MFKGEVEINEENRLSQIVIKTKVMVIYIHSIVKKKKKNNISIPQ